MPFQKGHKINNGRKLAEEHKRKISETHKGKRLSKKHIKNLSKSQKGKHPKTEFKKGNKYGFKKGHKLIGGGNTGNHHSKETRKKMSRAQKGENGSNWRGGITAFNATIRNGIEIRLWREAVFARDNWTCQKCKKRGGIKLHAHHINNFSEYPELRTAIDNGITLLEKVHKEFHKIYGKKNNTKEQLEEFLKVEVILK